MFFFDPMLFALFNADAQTPWYSIQLARVLSQWLPNLSAVLVLGTLVFGSPALRRNMLMLLLSMALAWLMVRLIRMGFPTQRPYQLDMGTLWVKHGGRSSFPSQHASGAFALAMAISLGVTRHRKWLVVAAWTAAVAIAWSRVHLGVHFVSDILAGALVGITSACLIWQTTYQLRRRGHLRVLPHVRQLRQRLQLRRAANKQA